MAEAPRAVSNGRRRKDAKSRTGCRTCKIRHVKCGEETPACLRCSTTGRACEWYGNHILAQDSRSRSSLLVTGLRSSRSERDNRGFDYFKYNASLALMGFDHRSEFWRQMVPQLSEASPAVLRAVLALSALHEKVYNENKLASVSASNVLFLRQYNKSIRHLCSRQSTQPIQSTLICCVIFICLENLSGNHDLALSHLKNGLALLRDWYSKDTQSASEKQEREMITLVFRRLDIQATIFLDSRQPDLNPTSIEHNVEGYVLMPLSFASLSAAQIALEDIEVRLFYVLTATSSSQWPSLLQSNRHTPARRTLLRGLAARFAQWKKAFDAFSLRESPNMQRQDLQLSLLLGLHYHTSLTMLDVKSSPDFGPNGIESCNDLRFTRINDLCKTLISASTTSKSTFSADTGIVAPLYFAAMNATHIHTRQQAIALLRLIKIKEGFWNAATVAGIAEKVLLAQIAGTPGTITTGGIPDLASAHRVTCC